jgi:hypothetical protein
VAPSPSGILPVLQHPHLLDTAADLRHDHDGVRPLWKYAVPSSGHGRPSVGASQASACAAEKSVRLFWQTLEYPNILSTLHTSEHKAEQFTEIIQLEGASKHHRPAVVDVRAEKLAWSTCACDSFGLFERKLRNKEFPIFF